MQFNYRLKVTISCILNTHDVTIHLIIIQVCEVLVSQQELAYCC